MKESFKNIFENFEPTPPPMAWESIASNLDAHKNALIYAKLKKAGIVITTALLISGVVLYSILSNKKTTEIENIEKSVIENSSTSQISNLPESIIQNAVSEESTSILSTIKKTLFKNNKNDPESIFPPLEKEKSGNKLSDSERALLYADVKKQKPSSSRNYNNISYVSPLDDDFLEYYYFDKPDVKMPAKSKNENSTGEKVIGSNYEDKDFKNKIHISDIISVGFAVERGIYFGLGAGAHYSTLSGGRVDGNDFFKSNFTDKIFSMGNSLEFVTGFDFNKNFGIVAEVKYTQINQKYLTPYFDLGLVKEENLKLNYIRLPILFKFRTIKLMKHNYKPMAINYLIGPHISHLVMVSRLVDGEKGNFAHTINQRELGITAGIEADLFLSPNFFMTIGYRAEMGWGTVESQLAGRIRSFNTGIYARFNFRQPQTIKKTTSYYK
jgi:hemerythrin superfamily protein